jgi:hypothetical protein
MGKKDPRVKKCQKICVEVKLNSKMRMITKNYNSKRRKRTMSLCRNNRTIITQIINGMIILREKSRSNQSKISF